MATIDDLEQAVARMEEAFILIGMADGLSDLLGSNQPRQAQAKSVLFSAHDANSAINSLSQHEKDDALRDVDLVSAKAEGDLNRWRSTIGGLSGSFITALYTQYNRMHIEYAFPSGGPSPWLTSEYDRVFKGLDAEGMAWTGIPNNRLRLNLTQLFQEILNSEVDYRHEPSLRQYGICGNSHAIRIPASHLVPKSNYQFMTLVLIYWLRIWFRAYLVNDVKMMQLTRNIFREPAASNFVLFPQAYFNTPQP
ncbi:MAG: hypothetical protein Q7R39_10360 [Dehalococcoidia bacterium]|nr:hypothetical protein [Dehalococcoidia bacterium]